MNGRLNALALVLGFLGWAGLAALVLGVADLDVAVGWKVVALVLSLGMLVWKKLPDEDADGTPDAFEGFGAWLQSRLPWLAVVVVSGALLGHVGCGGLEVGVQEPVYSVEDSEDDDAVPDQATFGLTITTNKGANVRLFYVQGFGGLYPATLCAELVSDEGVAFERLCGSCQWAEGVSACRLLPDLETP